MSNLKLPSYVKDPNAQAEFARILKLLGKEVKEVDLSLLVDYAITHGEIIKLRSRVINEGDVLIGPKGGSYVNPTTNILLSKISHMSTLRGDLFFTPKSRKEKLEKKKTLSLKEKLADEEETSNED